MTITFKAGVGVVQVDKEVFNIISVASSIWERQGWGTVVVTSISDGVHKPTSLHYWGKAVDLRVWGIEVIHAATLLKEELGKDYDVVVERDHIHVEYDPKKPEINV